MRTFDYDFYHENRFGSAKWADESSLKRGRFFKPSGLQLGYFNDRPFFVDGDGPIITIAGSRSGKGRDVIVYNTCKYKKGSMLINDPRGELSAISSMSQHRNGIKVYNINPFNSHDLPAHNFNVLDILTPKSPTLYNDAQSIVENFIEVDQRQPIFDETAQKWLKYTIITLVKTKGSITLSQVSDAVSMLDSDRKEFYNSVLKPMQTLGKEAAGVAGEIMDLQMQAGDGSAGFYNSVATSLRMGFSWMQPALRKMISGQDFSLNSLTNKRKPVKIFLIFPDDALKSCAPLIRLIFTVGMLYKQRKPKAKRVIYLIDEAGQLGHFEALKKALTFGAGAGIRTWSIFQDIGQIAENYGKSGVITFLGSSQTRQFFGVRDGETAQLICNMLGNQTLSYNNLPAQRHAAKARQQGAINIMQGKVPITSAYEIMQDSANMTHQEKQARPLMTPDEILNMPPDKQILMVSDVEEGRVLADRCPYYKQRSMAGWYMPNPYHPPKNFVKVKGGLLFGYARVISWSKPLLKRNWPQFQKGRKIVVRTWI